MFGEVVRAHRRRLGLTQDVCGIRKIEANRIAAPWPATVRLLAEAFGLCGGDRDSWRIRGRRGGWTAEP